MSEQLNTALLRAVLDEYATPDPKIVGTIPRNGINLAYVSHADITKILIEVDPAWSWQPIEWVNGRPAINVENGTATMWGTLTLLGKSMLGVGSVRADKQDLDKELVGDFLRNAAMRFGIALSLWSKQDWSDNTTITSLPAVQAKRAEEAKPYVGNHPAKGVPSPKVVRDFVQDNEPTPDEVAEIAAQFNATIVENITPIKAASSGAKASDKQKGLISKLAKEKVDGDCVPLMKQLFNKDAVGDLTSKEASALIKHLMDMR
ncbi:hypothetical protein UFOVP689_29 [uncultured Caudovirales phage]|uniref:Uncharacterized protein n=1 Tax=uncultured Caudovirales phage TaxID=2100421 RepID=A0A6J5NKU7_9CAUD|nr:hypothetical protein UFOVP689_29 [uncultured Caudovirales phage]